MGRWRGLPCNHHGLGLRGGGGEGQVPYLPHPSSKLLSTCGEVGWGEEVGGPGTGGEGVWVFWLTRCFSHPHATLSHIFRVRVLFLWKLCLVGEERRRILLLTLT